VGAARRRPGGAADLHPAPTGPQRVDGPERGRGEGDEQLGMGGDGVGNALAAHKAGPDELESVGAVHAGARRAARRAAGAAGLQQHPVRLAFAVEEAAGLAGGGVDLVDPTVQPHRLLAVAGRAHLRLPARKACRVARAGAQVLDEPGVKPRRPASAGVPASLLHRSSLPGVDSDSGSGTPRPHLGSDHADDSVANVCSSPRPSPRSRPITRWLRLVAEAACLVASRPTPRGCEEPPYPDQGRPCGQSPAGSRPRPAAPYWSGYDVRFACLRLVPTPRVVRLGIGIAREPTEDRG